MWTDVAVILTTDDIAGAGAATYTNSFDGRASQTDKNV